MQQFDFDILDSTNNEARRLLVAGSIEHSAVVTARGQTAGRGTHGRSWASPAGAGLYLSYVCRNRNVGHGHDDFPLTTAYTQAAGVACVEAVRETTGVVLRIKPVNDLFWDGRKVGGILTEAFVELDRLTALIIGVGINIYPANRVLSSETVTAVCLADAVAPRKLSASIVESIQTNIVAHLGEFLSLAKLAGIESEWRQHLVD